MSKVESTDRCMDCRHVRIWSTDRAKGTCTLHPEEGFRADRRVPAKCGGKVDRK